MIRSSKMKTIFQVIVLLFYSFFTYFFWIERAHERAAIIICILGVLCFFHAQSRLGLNLVVIVAITHFLNWICSQSMYLQWPLDFYIMAAAGFLYLKFFDRKNSLSLGWNISFTKSQILSILIINVPSVAVLHWYFMENKEVAKQWPIPELPIWAMPIFVLLIAAVNGLREEMYFRGLLQSQTNKDFSPWFTMLFQAILFGSLHFSGAFPQGWIGVFLTALWGGAIAIQFQIFRSIKLAWLTHSIADAIMFTAILLAR